MKSLSALAATFPFKLKICGDETYHHGKKRTTIRSHSIGISPNIMPDMGF
jgi:hypothetical protein